MAYVGHVVIADANARNLDSILRDANAQNLPVLFWNVATTLWNWQDAAGVKFAGSGAVSTNYLPDLVALRAALDADGVDIP